MKKLEGKVALITGASHGLGSVTAKMFAAAGASVYLVADSTREELAEVVAECLEAGAPRAEYGIFDMAGSAVPRRVCDAALHTMGSIDVLVSNASVRVRRRFGEFTDSDFERLVAVNLHAPFMLAQAVSQVMRERGGGRIIFVASQLGCVATPGAALYGMGKAALIHLAKSMALELATEGIMVNAVSPGPVDTESKSEIWVMEPDLPEQRLNDVPMKRFARPEEVAEAILFLASTEAEYITGHNLVIDGGYLSK
ncbi:MAG: SDR family NAD(P)-dependent oxidoreductase [Burkholderiales bacterium]